MNTLKRLLCSIIALALWVSCCVSAFAEDINRTNVYKVSAVSNVINYTADIFLLERNKQVYISEYEAELVTGYKIVKNERGTFCSKNGISSVVNCNSIDVDDQVFFDLFELMNALRVEYKFFEDSGTLSFIAPLYTPQELTDECYNVFGGNYGVTFLDNNYGIPLAAIYNIIGGFKYIEYFSGQYQQKQYEKALCNIITVEEDNSIFKLLDDTDEVSGNLSMVKELAGSLIDDKDYLANIFGWDVSDYIEFYDWAKEELKQYGLSTGDVIDIAAAFFSSKNANEIYKSGVEYALKNNDSLTDKNMRNAVNVVLNTYEGGIPRAATAVSQLVMTISTGKANQEVKEFLKGTAGYNSTICKAVKLALDELFSMKELTNAVEQSVAAREFQLLACDSFRSAAAKVQEGKYSEEDLLTVKYSTILYLRCCQYAYSLYDGLIDKWVIDYWKDYTQTAIEKIAAYDDAELKRDVKNQKIDTSKLALSSFEYMNDVSIPNIPENHRLIEHIGNASIYRVEKKTYNDGILIIDVFADYLVMEKANTAFAAEIINSRYKDIEDNVQQSEHSFADFISDSGLLDDPYSLPVYSYDEASIKYYDDAIISIAHSWSSYVGGATDEYGAYGQTYDLNDGRYLKLSDLISGDPKEIFISIITNSDLSEHDRESVFGRDLGIDDLGFYIEKDGEIILCFDKYEIPHSENVHTGLYIDKASNNRNDPGHSGLAPSEEAFIWDEADILTDSEREKLNELCRKLTEEHEFGVYIMTVNDYTDYGSGDVYDVSTQIFLEKGLGVGDDADGIFLILSMDERDYAFCAHGYGEKAITAYTSGILEQEFLDNFRNNDWYGGFRDYAETSVEIIEDTRAGKYDEPEPAADSFFAGFPDGDYDAYMDNETTVRLADGSVETVLSLTRPAIIPDIVVKTLKVGSVIDLGKYGGYGSLEIKRFERKTNNWGSEWIKLDDEDDGYVLHKLSSGDWYLGFVNNDYAVNFVYDNIKVIVGKDVPVYDDYSYFPEDIDKHTQIPDLRDFFDRNNWYETKDICLTIKDGKIISILIYFVPQL